MDGQLVILLVLLFTKHTIIDFPLQGPFQYLNKGTYGHPGGILHASMHTFGTLLCLAFFVNPIVALWWALADGVVHYHIDWAKMNLTKKLGYGPTTHEQFWWLLGADQYLHALTYILMAFFIVTGLK